MKSALCSLNLRHSCPLVTQQQIWYQIKLLKHISKSIFFYTNHWSVSLWWDVLPIVFRFFFFNTTLLIRCNTLFLSIIQQTFCFSKLKHRLLVVCRKLSAYQHSVSGPFHQNYPIHPQSNKSNWGMKVKPRGWGATFSHVWLDLFVPVNQLNMLPS